MNERIVIPRFSSITNLTQKQKKVNSFKEKNRKNKENYF